MKCPTCGMSVQNHEKDCPACLNHCGFPNVRAALATAEVAALNRRLAEAIVSCKARGCQSVLNAFGSAALSSQIIMSRSLTDLQSWIAADNRMLVTYHSQVRSGARVPEDNAWDRGRVAAESTIHPIYFENIQYACISLDGRGVEAWGAYYVTFKEPLVAHRTTVFEENPFNFAERHKIAAGRPPPAGYRANWGDRNKLAQAKLHIELQPSTNATDFPQILVKQGKDTGDADFIEAHIYGPLHRNTIEAVSGPKPKNKLDGFLWSKVKKNLKSLGAKVQELS